MPSLAPPQRVHLTIAQKLKLIEVAELRDYTLAGLTRWAAHAFDLPQPLHRATVRTILSKAKQLKQAPLALRIRKQLSNPTLLAYESRVVREFDSMESDGGVESVRDGHLLALARMIADDMDLDAALRPGFSNGWLYRFKQRHGIKSRRLHGEAESVSPEAANAGRAAMRALTDKYAARDIYNMDETSFYFRQLATTTLTRRTKVAGKKADKTRLTMCVATNADGSDKLPLLFIGKSKQPVALRGHDITSELNCVYTNTQKAWMNSRVFRVWLKALNVRMAREDRQILLLVDNVSSHVQPAEALSNIKLEFLPVNTTSVLQPMDQGVIVSLKRGYTKIKIDTAVARYLRRENQEKVTVFTAMRWAKQAWDAISPFTIRNCWAHSGIVSVRWKGEMENLLG